MYKTTTDLAKAKAKVNTRGKGQRNSCACLALQLALTQELLAPLAVALSLGWGRSQWCHRRDCRQPHHLMPAARCSPSAGSDPAVSLQRSPAEIHACCTAHTDKEHREGCKQKKINYRIIQGLTGRYTYIHKTVLVSSVSRLKSELSTLPRVWFFFFFQYILFQASKEMRSNHCD